MYILFVVGGGTDCQDVDLLELGRSFRSDDTRAGVCST